MRKIIGFIIIVILIILIIILSNKYYGNQSKNKSLSSANTTTRVNTNTNSNTNTNKTTTNNNSTVVEEKNTINQNDSVERVPDTATDDDSGYVAVESFDVIINNKVLNVGDREQINVIITPNNASEREVVFTSSNEDVLTITSTGIIKAHKSGSSLVTVSMNNHNDYKIIINVK